MEVENKCVGNLKSKCAAGMKFKLGKNSYASAGQSSTATTMHRSLKRKLQIEFDTIGSEIADGLDAFHLALQNKVHEKLGVKAEPESSTVKTTQGCFKKFEAGVVIKDAADSTKAIMNMAECRKSKHDSDGKLKYAPIIDLTEVDEELEISPTQVGTICESDDDIDITKLDKNPEVTSKEVIDLTKEVEDVQITSIEDGEDVEVWEVVDLTA